MFPVKQSLRRGQLVTNTDEIFDFLPRGREKEDGFYSLRTSRIASSSPRYVLACGMLASQISIVAEGMVK